MKKLFVLILFFALLVTDLFAQKIVRCNTPEFEQLVLNANPGLQQLKSQIDSMMRIFIQSSNFRTLTSANSVITIPVVVHVIGDNAIAQITAAKVNEQISILNQDYGKISGSPGDGNGVNTGIQFCLATQDPIGNPTNGIIHITGSHGPYKNILSDNAALKSLSNWPATDYLNIWVCDAAYPYLGWGTFPYMYLGSSDEYQDGVVIGYKNFGNNPSSTPYGKGRTLTHEAGHWLNLYHTFQRGDNGSEVTCLNNDCTMNGDLCCDTPPVWNSNNTDPDDGANYGCPTGTNTCHTDNPDLPDLIQDYMDYTDDACMNIFTSDQKDRMQATLIGIRSSLLYSIGCKNHCSNFICDGDEACMTNHSLPVDCGGVDCIPCPNGSSGTLDPCRVHYLGAIAVNGYKSDIPCINYNDNIVLTPVEPLCHNTPKWLWPITFKEQRCNSAPDASLCSRHTIDFWNCNCRYFQYFIEIFELDNNFNPVGPSRSNWFTLQPSDINATSPSLYLTYNITVSQGDLNNMGVILKPSKLYLIKLARNSNGWKETTRFFRVNPEDIYLDNVSVTADQFGVNVTLKNISAPITNVTVAATTSVHILPNTIMGLNSMAILKPPFGCAASKVPDIAMSSNVVNIYSSQSQYPNDASVTTPVKQLIKNDLNNVIAPNPSDGRFTLQINSQNNEPVEINIYNSFGQLIYHQFMNSQSQYIDLSSHPKGIYFVKVQTEGKMYTEKVILQ